MSVEPRLLKSALQKFCADLIRRFASRETPINISVRKIVATNTDGYRATLNTEDSLAGDVELQVWLDEYLGGPEPQFWVGLVATRERDLLPYKESKSLSVASMAITERWVTQKEPYKVVPTRRSQLKAFLRDYVVFEYYAEDDLYLGKYLTGGMHKESSAVDSAESLLDNFLATAGTLKKLSIEDRYYTWVANSGPVIVYRKEEGLVRAFVAFMRRENWSVNSEVVKDDGRRVDVVCERDGKVIFGEAKFCPKELCRAAIRQAMGQLLDYSQDVKVVTNRLIVLDVMPNRRELELATSNGFDIAARKRRMTSEFELFWSNEKSSS